MVDKLWLFLLILMAHIQKLIQRLLKILEGMSRLFKRFSFPGGIGSHMTAQTPGSLHEGGELGYVLSHATGAILDQPEQIAFAVVGGLEKLKLDR